MLRGLMIDNVWVAMGVCTALYALDYCLTLVGARMYYGGANRHGVSETGYELNWLFKRSINVEQRFSGIFVVMLVIIAGLTWFAWVLYVGSELAPWVFEFLLGAFVCCELPVLQRHLVSIGRMRFTRRSQGIEGQVRVSAWLTYWTHSIDVLAFGLILGFLFVVFGSWFLAGGAIACLALAWSASKRAKTLRFKSDRDAGPPSRTQ